VRIGSEATTHTPRAVVGRDRRVSERIYDYILTGRPDQRRTRPAADGSDAQRAGGTSATDTPV
jgi:hypothetical protein